MEGRERKGWEGKSVRRRDGEEWQVTSDYSSRVKGVEGEWRRRRWKQKSREQEKRPT